MCTENFHSFLQKSDKLWQVSGGLIAHLPPQNTLPKYWPNFSFKISPELQLQTPDQTLCKMTDQKLSFMTKPQLRNLQQTVANAILINKISNSNNLNKFWVGIFTRQGHINQVY